MQLTVFANDNASVYANAKFWRQSFVYMLENGEASMIKKNNSNLIQLHSFNNWSPIFYTNLANPHLSLKQSGEETHPNTNKRS